MITVHHLDNSRSQRVLWLLEELGVPYEITLYERDPVTMLAPKELRDIHPLGKAPVVTDDGSGETIVLAESGAVLEHLAETYGDGRLMPERGTRAHRDCRYWLHYGEGSAMPPLLLKLVFTKVATDAPWIVRPIAKAISKQVHKAFITPQLKLHMGFWEKTLGARAYFAGEAFTVADVQMVFPVEAALARGGRRDDYPKVAAWLDRVQSRPTWAKAIARGGPYAILG